MNDGNRRVNRHRTRFPALKDGEALREPERSRKLSLVSVVASRTFAQRFTQGAAQTDDITFLLIEHSGAR